MFYAASTFRTNAVVCVHQVLFVCEFIVLVVQVKPGAILLALTAHINHLWVNYYIENTL